MASPLTYPSIEPVGMHSFASVLLGLACLWFSRNVPKQFHHTIDSDGHIVARTVSSQDTQMEKKEKAQIRKKGGTEIHKEKPCPIPCIRVGILYLSAFSPPPPPHVVFVLLSFHSYSSRLPTHPSFPNLLNTHQSFHPPSLPPFLPLLLQLPTLLNHDGLQRSVLRVLGQVFDAAHQVHPLNHLCVRREGKGGRGGECEKRG